MNTSVLDVRKIRADFPIFSRRVHDKPLVFLDSAASSQKPGVVIEAMDDYYRTTHANVHRGVHTLSEEATELYEGARKKIARFIHARSSREIIYTRNTTESINLVALTWGRANLKKGDEILRSMRRAISTRAHSTGCSLRRQSWSALRRCRMCWARSCRWMP